MLYRLLSVLAILGCCSLGWAPVEGRTTSHEIARIPEPVLPVLPEPPPYAAKPDTYRGIPGWVMRGILYRETRSRYRADGSIVYVDKARGAAGEVGCFQALPEIVRAFSPYTPDEVHRSPRKSEEVAAAYLRHLYEGAAKRSWRVAVMRYHVGPTRDTRIAADYLATVVRVGPTVPVR